MNGELPIKAAPMVKPDDMAIVVEWLDAKTSPPPDKSFARIYCVSTPGLKWTHQLAKWTGDGWQDLGEEKLSGVTFWCDLPQTPEYIAAHPEEYNTEPLTCELCGEVHVCAGNVTLHPIKQPSGEPHDGQPQGSSDARLEVSA